MTLPCTLEKIIMAEVSGNTSEQCFHDVNSILCKGCTLEKIIMAEVSGNIGKKCFHDVNSILYPVTNIHAKTRILLTPLMYSIVKIQPYLP